MKDRHRFGSPWIALAPIGLASLILSIDDGVLNLALPPISDEFQASTSELQWTINAYLLAFASLLLTMGALGDRLGRKRLFLAGVILFGISSAAAALSTSMGMIIASRALMGVGGAMALPQTLSIIRASFTDQGDRGKAIGIWAGVFGLGYGIGPVVGGILLEYFEWYSVFLLNIPISILTFVGGILYLEESRDAHAPKLDLPGVILSIIALFSLVYGIIKAGEKSWTDDSVILWLCCGTFLLTIFIVWERNTSHPMLPMRFFRNMSFTGANLAMTLAAFSTFAILFFFSQYLQSVQGYSPLAAAWRIAPAAIVIMIMSLLGSRMGHAFGPKLPVSLGLFICAIGFVYLSFPDPDTSYAVLIGGFVIMGGGYGLAWSPATDSIMGSVPESRAGVGSAMDQTTQFIGGALGVATLGAIMNNIYRDRIDDLIDNLESVAPLSNDKYQTISDSIQSAHIIAKDLPSEPAQLIIKESGEAFTSGMTEANLIAGIVLAVASVITLFILPNRIQPAEE